jgi:3-phenylpropionate/trans-cinnamate dioxygenase ferredoxin subunit
LSGEWHAVALAADIAPGEMRGFLVEGRDIVVCNSRQGWFALDNVCTHAYARLSEGRLRGCRLICPLHGASFDVRDGSVLGLPANAPLTAHRLRIEDGRVEVALGA